MIPHLRIARPSDDLDALVPFYQDGLGLGLLGTFIDHDGFDGIMFGAQGAGYHFEFTKCRAHTAGKAPTQDNLAVFYLPDPVAWVSALNGMHAAGFMPVRAFNPYWDVDGRTFEDPDGYRIVLQNAKWGQPSEAGMVNAPPLP